MRDPVSGFDYPEAWVRKCPSPDLLRLVEEGLAVLTSSGTVLRRGYTTGTTAAAACKAAVLSLSGEIDCRPCTYPLRARCFRTGRRVGREGIVQKIWRGLPGRCDCRMRICGRRPSPEGGDLFFTWHGYRQVFTHHSTVQERGSGDNSFTACLYPYVD